jgi:hypothetical protein
MTSSELQAKAQTARKLSASATQRLGREVFDTLARHYEREAARRCLACDRASEKQICDECSARTCRA